MMSSLLFSSQVETEETVGKTASFLLCLCPRVSKSTAVTASISTLYTVEPLNNRHIRMDCLSTIERLSSFRGQKCIATEIHVLCTLAKECKYKGRKVIPTQTNKRTHITHKKFENRVKKIGLGDNTRMPSLEN